MEQQPIQITNEFIANALRQCGYTTYSAICDIVDNSIEPEVGSTVVSITRNGRYDNFDALVITDNGSGMSFERLKTALALGAQTGKTASNLGYYGVGLKTAALSMGKCLEVWTKTKNDTHTQYAIIDLDDYYIDHKDINVKFYQNYDNTIEEQGTIVRISKLDKISTRDFKNLKATLKTYIGLTYNKYIYNKICKFKIGSDVIEPIDTIGNMSNIPVESLSGGLKSFTVNGITIPYNAWYIPSNAQPNGTNWLPRGNRYSGIFIYRNNRLIGQGLSFGLLGFGASHAKHVIFNGLRIELFMDGNSDYLTGSSYLKTVEEKDSAALNQDFATAMFAELKPYVKMAKDRDVDIKNEETKSEEQKFLDSLADSLNKNIKVFIKPNTKQVTEELIEDITKKKEKSEKESKKSRLQKFFKFNLSHLGEHGPIVEYEDNIEINMDHTFYQEVYQKLDDNSKWAICVIFASEFATRKQTTVGNSELTNMFNEHDVHMGNMLCNIISKICPDIQQKDEVAA